MNRQRAIAILQDHRDELRRRGVARAAIFGSVARGDARADSDVDVLVEIEPTADLGVWEYVGLKRYIADLFPTRVDVADLAQLRPRVRHSVEGDAVYAF